MSLNELWDEYFRTRDKKIRNLLVRKYSNFAGYIVGRVVSEPPPGLTKEDLNQSGLYGLIQAVERYGPDQGAKFETYASKRIRGAVVDSIRSYGKSGGGLTRSAMTKLKKIQKAVKELESKHKRNPTQQEIAEEMGIPLKEYRKMLSEVSNGVQISLDDMVGIDNNLSLSEVIEDEETKRPDENSIMSENNELLAKAIDDLKEKERLVIMYYYHEDMTLREIGAALNLTEGRISQIHAHALVKLRNKLTGGE